MEVSRIRALRGPNLWSRHTAIEAIITCAEMECFIDRIPGFEARLRERFPEIALLQPTISDEVIAMAHALEFAALGLQAQAGCPVTFSRTAQTLEPGVYQAGSLSSWHRNSARRPLTISPFILTTPCVACASSTRTCVSGQAPAPSFTPLSHAAFPTAG